MKLEPTVYKKSSYIVKILNEILIFFAKTLIDLAPLLLVMIFLNQLKMVKLKH